MHLLKLNINTDQPKNVNVMIELSQSCSAVNLKSQKRKKHKLNRRLCLHNIENKDVYKQ